MTLTTGTAAPDFNIFLSETESTSLHALKGKKIILYFYPKDDTSGCTKEACAFKDLLPSFDTHQAVVIGVSPDSFQSHEKFKEKYALPFWLAPDESTEICQRYGVWKEQSMYGRTYMGVERTTFLIDEKGIIRQIWNKVKVDGHAEDVLQALQA